MTEDVTLARRERGFIVLVALLQGLLLYIADVGMKNAWWPFSELGGCVVWYTLVLGVPSAMTLSVLRLDDRRFWQHAALIVAILAPLAGWAAWNATGAPGLRSQTILAPYGLTTCLALFVALPYLQCRLAHGRWCAPYAELFENAWQNALTLALAALFTGICWAVLMLWQSLFMLIKIEFFRDLFGERPFVYLATGTMVGFGVLIGRTQHRPVQIARQIVFAIFTGLLPLLALIILMFAASLPFTGLEPLWKTRSAAGLLMCVILFAVTYVNAVWQDGSRPAPFAHGWARPLRWIVNAGLVALPLYAAIALYAIWLRVMQYGWTAERFYATLAAVVVAAYAVGYAISVLLSRTEWLATLPRVNIVISLFVIALVVAVNSPLLAPQRIGTQSQIARWKDGESKELDLEHLRFNSGRDGYRGLRELQGDGKVLADKQLAEDIARMLARVLPSGWIPPDEREKFAVKSIEELRGMVVAAENSAAPGDDFLAALLSGDTGKGSCRLPGSACVYIGRDFDGDGSDDALLCETETPDDAFCALWTKQDGRWVRVATSRFSHPSISPDRPKLRERLRAGEIVIEPRRWPDLRVGKTRVRIEPEFPPPGDDP